jgi:hypothetical protein
VHTSHTDSLVDAERRSLSTAPPGPADDLEREIDLTPYLAPLARRWPLLLALAVLGVVVGLAISGRRPIVYEATTTLLVQQAGSPAALSTARALLRNHTLASETLGELGLDREPHHLTPQRFISGMLTVEEVGGTHLLHVKARLPDAVLAAQASHTLSRKAVELNNRVNTEGTTTVRDQLKVLLDEAAEGLQAAEQELLAARSRTQLDVLRKDADVTLESRAAYQHLLVDLEGEKSRLAAAEQEIRGHEALLPEPRSPTAEAALRRSLTEKREGADPELLDLTNPNVNPVYQTLAFQIVTSRLQVAHMERRRRELAARGAGASEPKPFTSLYRGEMEIARLEDGYQLAKRTHADLAVRYDQSRTDSIGRAALLQIVDPAIPPEQPMSRRRKESMLAGGLGGLLAGATLALVFGRRRRPAAAAPPGSAAASQPL